MIAATYGNQSQSAKLLQLDSSTGLQVGEVTLRTVTNQAITEFRSMTRIGDQIICSYVSGTTEAGLGYINPSTGVVSNIPNAPYSPLGLGNRDGRILLGDFDYIQEFDLTTNTITLQTILQLQGGVYYAFRDVTWDGFRYVLPYDGASVGPGGRNALTFWDPGTGEFQGNPRIETAGTHPNGVDFDPTSGRFWVASYLEGTSTSRLSAYPQNAISQVPEVSFTINNALLADVLYIPVPAPAAVSLFGVAALTGARRRRIA
ncbi:MAG: hypothetical protein U0640_05155 [Phycisphaerales bacterium]